MKAIISIKDKNGNYAEVGMNRQTIISHLSSPVAVHRNIQNSNFNTIFLLDKDETVTEYRAQFFADEKIYDKPFRTDYMTLLNGK